MPSTPITPPRVDFFDPRTGKISREWYMFFISLRQNLDGITLDDLTDVNATSPSNHDILEWSSTANEYVLTDSPTFDTVNANTVTATTVNATDVVADNVDTVTASVSGSFNASTIETPSLLVTGPFAASSAQIGDVTGGDYLQVESTGFIETHGDARNWDDVYPSAVSVASTGTSIPTPTVYATTFIAPEFVGTGVQVKSLTMHFQIYHSYDEGTPVVPHIHLYIPNDVTGGTIKFYADIEWDNINDTGAEVVTTVSGTVVRTASEGISKNKILTFGSFTGTGKKISSILSMRIYRDPADAGDTFGASVWLKSADLHIHKNTEGSRTETVK